MADSTTPIVLTGATTMASEYLRGKGVDYRVALATGLAAGAFALLERADRQLAVGIAWIAFVGSMVTPRAGGAPAPAVVFLNAWNNSGKTKKK